MFKGVDGYTLTNLPHLALRSFNLGDLSPSMQCFSSVNDEH